MPELIRAILDLLKELCPFQKVTPWQTGLYTCMGWHLWTVGPGLWPVIPFVCEVYRVSMATAAGTTPLQSVTLRDQRTLTFSATLTYRVCDPRQAFYELERYQETVIEIASGVVSEFLRDAEPERFDPARGKWKRVKEECMDEINAVCRPHGVEVVRLSFPNFAFVRAVRLFVDKAVLSEGNHLTA